MKNISKSLIISLVGLSLVIGFSGCSVSDLVEDESSVNEEGLQVIEKESGNFDVKWSTDFGLTEVIIIKKGDEYGETIIESVRAESKTFEAECIITDMTSAYASYKCTGDRNQHDSKLIIDKGIDYHIKVENGHIAKTLSYDGDTQQINFK